MFNKLIFVLFSLFICTATEKRINGRIVGGESTTIKQHPYQIALLHSGKQICGGAVINENYIVTAAHCTKGFLKQRLSIRSHSSFCHFGGTLSTIASITIHPNYTASPPSYDVSVILLMVPLIFNDYCTFIKLAKSAPPPGTMATITGWGTTSEDGVSSPHLLVAQIPIISEAKCKETYGEIIKTNMICAGMTEGGKDTCQGDSGGPMVAYGELVGITSFGRGCARGNTPGVYSNVSILWPFITSLVGPQPVIHKDEIEEGKKATI